MLKLINCLRASPAIKVIIVVEKVQLFILVIDFSIFSPTNSLFYSLLSFKYYFSLFFIFYFFPLSSVGKPTELSEITKTTVKHHKPTRNSPETITQRWKTPQSHQKVTKPTGNGRTSPLMARKRNPLVMARPCYTKLTGNRQTLSETSR